MARQQLPSSAQPVSRGTSIAASAGVGVLTAAVGYLITYLAVASEVHESLGGNVAEWKGVAWYYYNAHAVDVHASGEIGSFGRAETVNFITESGATSTTVLYLVPPLVLIGAGGLLASHLEARDLGEAVVVGAPVTVGYVVVMGLGAVVTETSSEATFLGIEASGTMGPAVVPAVLLAGILYPLLFATVGATLVALVASRGG
ncbi:hypothetical protein [Natrialba swarupiae]|uniref:DUF7978 domain-containing protein n=1 Tax=Natrialba swarupiae TaxID=2448032 RepID=A0A5D5AM17_9EURY|nr:hypothetical protein [Natrialba swarupiae]TYT60742.1 hypothetical protein FYC77_17320 [Natrialba swarupiae]